MRRFRFCEPSPAGKVAAKPTDEERQHGICTDGFRVGTFCLKSKFVLFYHHIGCWQIWALLIRQTVEAKLLLRLPAILRSKSVAACSLTLLRGGRLMRFSAPNVISLYENVAPLCPFVKGLFFENRREKSLFFIGCHGDRRDRVSRFRNDSLQPFFVERRLGEHDRLSLPIRRRNLPRAEIRANNVIDVRLAHPAHPAHPAHSAQEDFPARLFLTMRTTIRVTTPTNAARTNSQPKFSPSHANIREILLSAF